MKEKGSESLTPSANLTHPPPNWQNLLSDHSEAALWFSMMTSWPARDYGDNCRSLLAVVVGKEEWEGVVRGAFRNPKEFVDRVADEERFGRRRSSVVGTAGCPGWKQQNSEKEDHNRAADDAAVLWTGIQHSSLPEVPSAYGRHHGTSWVLCEVTREKRPLLP